MKNIVLIGMMGCGKTTVGAMLARTLDRELVDTDSLIEKQTGLTISDLFALRGEAHFRDLEGETARELAGQTGLVISCGGGLPLQTEAIEPLWESGTVVWLRRDPGEAYDTMDKSRRPLAQEGRGAFVERFNQREPVYRRWAHHIIHDFSSPEATLRAVLEVVK